MCSTTLSVSEPPTVQAPRRPASAAPAAPPSPSPPLNVKSERRPEPAREPDISQTRTRATINNNRSTSSTSTSTFNSTGIGIGIGKKKSTNAISTTTTNTTTNHNSAPALAPAPAPPLPVVTASSTSFPIALNAETATDATRNSSTSTQNTYLHSHRQTNSSSKLPAYRFADLKTESLSLPSLLLNDSHNLNNDNNRIPSSPVSPDPDQQNYHRDTQPTTSQHPPPTIRHQKNSYNKLRVLLEQPREESRRAKSRPPTFRASTAALSSSTATRSSETANVKRSVSLDFPLYSAARNNTAETANTASIKSTVDSADTIVATRPQATRARSRRGSDSFEESSSHPQSLVTQGLPKASGTQSAPTSADFSKDWTQGQRELILPKTLQRTNFDERRGSIAKRPPVSYKPPTNSHSSSGSASIPPIRAFRSSGSRRSLTLDMSNQSPRAYTVGDRYGDSNHRDRTLRALEGRQDYAQQITPNSARAQADFDDSGDVFLKIAREDVSRRGPDEDSGYTDSQNAIARITRSSRRPLSAAIPSYQPSSPPQMTRRLSDQETSRTRGFGESPSGDRIARSLTFRGVSRERASEEPRPKGSSQLRASPLTPRSFDQDSPSESSPPIVNYSRRRQPSVDSGSAAPSRMSSLKQSSLAYGNGRTFNSSPLAPKSAELQKQEPNHENGAHGQEGTNSTTSTAAPSTVWDELDDLKSRIHRLELTGKLPPTSGAAISRASEERPPTANTNATTMSASPKRGSGSASQTGDVTITSGSQKDSHPILHSALAKSKQFLSSEVYNALETATTDALNLAAMMGTAGQPGPISSATSSVGGGPVVTDRQLRRKADSICRSLTELCLALSEGAAQINPQPTIAQSIEKSPAISPTLTKFTFTGFSGSKPPNSATDRSFSVLSSPKAASNHRPSNSATDRIFSVVSSPKASSRLEERRNSIFTSGALPSPRFASSSTGLAATTTSLASPTEYPTAGRKSSLVLSRNRRAQTEEPEDLRSKPPTVLRTRRAGTEEPEEQTERKPSLHVRSRRGTIDNEDDSRLRIPSRAIAEVHGSQTRMREYTSQVPLPSTELNSPLGSSALPRRRLASSTINTRLAQPSASNGLSTRRFADRSTPDRESFNPTADKAPEEREQRRFSLNQNTSLSRAGSLKRSNRQSMIAISSAAAQSNGYR